MCAIKVVVCTICVNPHGPSAVWCYSAKVGGAVNQLRLVLLRCAGPCSPSLGHRNFLQTVAPPPYFQAAFAVRNAGRAASPVTPARRIARKRQSSRNLGRLLYQKRPRAFQYDLIVTLRFCSRQLHCSVLRVAEKQPRVLRETKRQGSYRRQDASADCWTTMLFCGC